MQTFSHMLRDESVVPVVAVHDEKQALGLAQALIDGGINVIEVTLRNSFALQALSLIKKTFPEITLLAGTITTAEQFRQVAELGIDGVISPGLTPKLAMTANELQMPYLPGVGSASDIVMGIEHGLSELKLFPASVVGGIGALKAFAGPFPDIKFCPTGGIGADDYRDYLALPNVMCVGGSWVASAKDIENHNWQSITDNCLKLTQ